MPGNAAENTDSSTKPMRVSVGSVSYTHLDVYKRQVLKFLDSQG